MRILILPVFIFFTSSAFAQNFDGLYRQKVKTVDSTIEALYAVISGDAGVKRDWNLMKYLFADGAQLVPLRTDKDGRVSALYLSPDDYINLSGDYLEQNGFIEKEISRKTESYGNLTQVFSTYESYKSSKDAEPFARGINSIQLMRDRGRYFIVNITWQSETAEFPLPAHYLN